jgi:steroid 5-alpha reductase family enzyme
VPCGWASRLARAGVDEATLVGEHHCLYPVTQATGIIAFRARALPRWLGVGAALTAAALAVNGAFLGTGSVPALVLFLLWTLLASVHLLRRTWRKPVPVAHAQATARA